MLIDRRTFADPPARFRPSPLWVFNADPTDRELVWQIDQLKQRGFGGFFVHPRIGLATPFLKPPWFRQVGVCVRAAKARKMEAWLYDEDRWPSGFAGGLLLDHHPEFRSRDLVWGLGPDRTSAVRAAAQRVGYAGDPASRAAAGLFLPFRDFAVSRTRRGPAWRPLPAGAALRPGERVMAFLEHRDGDDNWFGGHTYVDVMNPRAVRAFLDLAYAPYAARFRREFGRTIPGVFTDEPMYRNWMSISLPWSEGLDRVMDRALPGGLNRLPAVVLDAPDSPGVRHAFLKAATRRFVDSFTKQVAGWCARHRVAMTGHWLAEDQMGWQANQVGAAMPHYVHEQVPGIDHLRRQADQRLTHKQVASVARQFDRRRVLSELYGVAGHTLSFEDQKWIGDWHLVNGITFFCHHLVLQTMGGDRKRDYPTTFSWHQPWWRDLGAVNDYFSRVGYALTRGRAVADVLVLHPIGSVWAEHRWGAGEDPAGHPLDRALVRVMDALAAAHRDFDLGDESILAEHARMEGGELRVAKAGRYRAIVVPPSTTWEASTVRLLERFAAAGGRIVFAGGTPARIDSRPAAARWRNLVSRSRRAAVTPAALDRALGPSRDFTATVNGRPWDGDIVYQHREEAGRHLYFVINRSRTRAKRCVLTLRGTGPVTVWDPVTGTDRELSSFPSRLALPGRPAHSAGLDGTPARQVEVELPVVGSLLLTVEPGADSTAPLLARTGPPFRLGAPVAITPDEENVLVLDRCRFTVNGMGDGAEHPVSTARAAAFDAAGLKAFAGLQPWRMAQRGIVPTRTPRLALTFTFRVGCAPPPLDLVIETPESFRIALNGRTVASRGGRAWRLDRRLVRLPLHGVRRGLNTLTLAGDYGLTMEIEDLFLLGRFRVAGPVAGPFTLEAYRPPARLGPWPAQGFRFYPGSMTYAFAAKVVRPGRYRLRLGRGVAALYRIRVDGRDRGRILWAPWELDLGPLTAGRHRIEVEAVGSLQNAFGPLHNTQYRTHGDCWWIGPDSFAHPKDWTDAYHAHPYGLSAAPELLPLLT